MRHYRDITALNKKKIKRELLRILSQVSSWLMNMYEPIIRWWHKRTLGRHCEICINTKHHNQGKVAVLLVYQPNGLAESTWLTLEHLRSMGYSTLLVSNCPLSANDAARVLPLCWQTMVRKNFGYDFGGYQDAMLHIMGAGVPVEQLVIMNDSIWFPLHTGCNLLSRMEANPAGFVGAFQLEPTRNKEKMVGKKRPFMGSFFWHFKAPVLRSEAFKSFWIEYKATSSKYATIRRGERRFTHHLLDAGIKGDSMFSRGQFDEWLQQQQGAALKQALQDLCTTDPDLAQQQKRLLEQHEPTTEWDGRAMQLAMAITESQNIMATAPLFMVRDMGLAFIKKSADDANVLAMGKLINFYNRHPEWAAPCILKEIKSKLGKQSTD